MLYFEGFKSPYKNALSPRPWQIAYAYFPKRVNDKWVWRENYYWREVYAEFMMNAGYMDGEWRKQYGTIFDVLRSEV
jgi:hypothetical protein